MDDLTTGFPLVAQASSVALRPGDGPVWPRVESRMVLGCAQGRGTVVLNGSRHPLRPGDLYLLPWGHRIRYDADPDDPFVVFGMHLIPWHRADAPVVLAVAHGPRQPLAGARWRQDRPLGVDATLGASGIGATSETRDPRLAALTHYAVAAGQRGLPGIAIGRALGVLALTEFETALRPAPQQDPALPPELRLALDWALAHLAQPITLADLAAAAGRGTTTLNRLFGRHLGTSPLHWVADRRVDRACGLLASTPLSVAQVARRVGIADPYYFSRVFKQRTGIAPTTWRSRRRTP